MEKEFNVTGTCIHSMHCYTSGYPFLVSKLCKIIDEKIAYIRTDEIIDKGSIYGILREENGFCKINNKIYEQLIYNHMMMKVIRKRT